MRRVEIDWLRTVAGAMAAVASAVLLSTLGAAGTIIGAALGSVVVTVISAYLSAGLATSRETLAKAQASARQKVGIAEAEVHRAERAHDTGARESHLDHAGERLAEANRELDRAGTPAPGWRERLAALPWKRIAWVSAALFVVALVAITAFELLVGRPVSSFTGGTSGGGGTTIGHVREEDSSGGRTPDQPSESPSPGETSGPTSEPGATSSPTAPEPQPASTPPPTSTPTPTDTAVPPEPTEPSPTEHFPEEPAPSASP